MKEEYDLVVEKNKRKTKYDYKRKRHVPIKPSTWFIAKAVRQFSGDLKVAKNSDAEFVRAVNLATRSYNKIDSLRDSSSCPPKKARTQGASRKRKASEVRIGLFNWFIINVRETLKGRLPRRIFKMKANQLYEEWLTKNPVPENERLKFSNQGVKEWEQEHGISLRKPSKKYSIKKEDLVERLQDYLNYVWRVRRCFIEKYGVDPPVINGD